MQRADGRYARTVDSKRYLTALASLVTLIVASLVLSLLFGLVWEMTVLSVGSVNEAHQAPLVANLVVAVCLIGLVLYAHKRLDLALARHTVSSCPSSSSCSPCFRSSETSPWCSTP